MTLDPKAMRSSLDRGMRLARWMGMPIGFQVDMFADRSPIEDKWAEEGKTAGLAGENCTPPASLPASGVQIWIQAWHAGQAVLASAFAKKAKDTPAQQEPADTSRQPFREGAGAPV